MKLSKLKRIFGEAREGSGSQICKLTFSDWVHQILVLAQTKATLSSVRLPTILDQREGKASVCRSCNN